MALQFSRERNGDSALASKIVAVAALGAGGVGAIPLPFADYPLLLAIETKMVELLKSVYGIRSEDPSLTGYSSLSALNLDIVGIAGSIGWLIANSLKATPAIGWVSGSTIDAAIASTTVLTLGTAVSIVFSNVSGGSHGGSFPSGAFIDEVGGGGRSGGSGGGRGRGGGGGGTGADDSNSDYKGGPDNKGNDKGNASWSMSEKIFSGLENSAELRQSLSRKQTETEAVDVTSQNGEVLRMIRETAKSIRLRDTVKLLKSGVSSQERIAKSISLEMNEIQNSLEGKQRTAFEMVRSQALTESMTAKVRKS